MTAGEGLCKTSGDIPMPSDPAARSLSGEATLDQLLAEPIVRQLMQRDGTDEAAIRQLMRKVAAGR